MAAFTFAFTFTFTQLGEEVELVTEPHDREAWMVRVAHFRDPDGTLIEVNEPLEEAAG